MAACAAAAPGRPAPPDMGKDCVEPGMFRAGGCQVVTGAHDPRITAVNIRQRLDLVARNGEDKSGVSNDTGTGRIGRLRPNR